MTRDPRLVKAHFYLAKTLVKGASNAKSKFSDAFLHLEFCSSKGDAAWTGNALYLLARLHIRELKFEEAQESIVSAQDMNIQLKRLAYLKDFVEGVINLQK